MQADVSDLDSVHTMRGAVADELGHTDIIVNNAVHQYDWTSVLEQAPADYESQFRTCVLHNVFMAKAFVPHMIERLRRQRHARDLRDIKDATADSGTTRSF